MTKKRRSQFWVGQFDSRQRFDDFVGENPDYWSEEEEDEDEEEEEEDIPMSPFAASQGEIWIDEDFMEAGYNDDNVAMPEKFRGYSYWEQWGEPLTRKLASLGIEDVNALIMLGIDEPPNGSEHLQVTDPQSHKAEGINLVFVGEIEH